MGRLEGIGFPGLRPLVVARPGKLIPRVPSTGVTSLPSGGEVMMGVLLQEVSPISEYWQPVVFFTTKLTEEDTLVGVETRSGSSGDRLSDQQVFAGGPQRLSSVQDSVIPVLGRKLSTGSVSFAVTETSTWESLSVETWLADGSLPSFASQIGGFGLAKGHLSWLCVEQTTRAARTSGGIIKSLADLPSLLFSRLRGRAPNGAP